MSIAEKWLEEKAKFWSKKVTEKGGYSPPEGTFTKSGEDIAAQLLKDSKDAAQAMQRLMFYINRSGDKLEKDQKGSLERAKEIIHSKTETGKEEAKEK